MFREIILVLLFFLLVSSHNCANGSITIDIESQELQQLGEILVESYMEQSMILSSRRRRLNHCKKIATNAAQIFGIMFSLVGANLITNMLQPLTMGSTQAGEMCKHQFGCDQNLCWKSCGNSTHSWCFTTAKSESIDIQVCYADYDCSPCWDCLGICHTPKP